MTTRPGRRNRWWVYPLLGVAATWGITWIAAAFVPFGSTVSRSSGRGLTDTDWHHQSVNDVFAATRVTSTVMIRALEYKESDTLGTLPAWARLPEPPEISGLWQSGFYEIAQGYGWPMRAAYFRFSGEGSGAATTGTLSGAFPLPANAKGAWYDPRGLPYLPIWPGLVADIGFWTAVWWVVLVAPGWTRRSIRRRRGRCESCGYSRAGLAPGAACPECGN